MAAVTQSSPINRAAPVGAVVNSVKTSKVRLGALDTLRGVAALNVVLLHFTTDFHRDFSPTRIASITWDYGAYGVHLFFLISGFVIFMTAERTQRPYDFIVSRFSRLYPPYWAALVFTTAVLIAVPLAGGPTPAHLLRRALVDLSMFQSWARVGSVDSVYWTLGVELSFYLVLLVLIWRKALHMAIPVMTGLVVLALCDHLLIRRPLSVPYDYLRNLLFLEHAYLFTAGMVLYRIRQRFKPVYLLVLALCALCPATANYWPNHPSVDALIAAGLAVLMYFATSGRLDWIACRPLVYLGGISYSLYLTHHWAGLLFLKAADNRLIDPNLALAMAIGLCLLLATAMTYLIEKPSLRWFRAAMANKTERVTGTTSAASTDH
jgi:peptidoglycan/LPS O-acetylase OafA/YrhL